MTPGRPCGRRRPVGPSIGAAAALSALAVIWGLRSSTGADVYVSQLGAEGQGTAPAFNGALLLLAAGGLLVARGCRDHRNRVALLGAWSVTTTLTTASAAFAVASQVTCTAGCPVPLTPGAGLQDLIHVVVAVVGFGAAAWAMLQVCCSAVPRGVRLASGAAALAVASVAAAGGLLSVFGVATDVGALLEFSAMTVAVLWLAGYASWTSLSGPVDGPG
ncbi:DUF998 domain-containing protein [Kineococcus sp. TBRC 1896]|uniref:DUF998 domain-containing protein n=1 Tax=Kineococcus mangrovi TaxID=1660183 RepID=A0ABV4I4K3_9ACTN